MVYLLTQEQRILLTGTQYEPGSYFNPIQDADDNWIISEQEVNLCNIQWVKELPSIVYKLKPFDP